MSLPEPGGIRVMLVDDEPVVLEGLRCVLASAVEVVAQARTGTEALSVLAERPVDVVLVSDRLPDVSATDLIARAEQQDAAPAWVVRATGDRHWPLVRRSRATAYVPKAARVSELVHVIRRVASDAPGVTARSGNRARRGLSERDRSVIGAVLRGRSNDEIGAELGVARKTVEACLTRLFARFGVATRTELALRADREQWLDERAPWRPAW